MLYASCSYILLLLSPLSNDFQIIARVICNCLSMDDTALLQKTAVEENTHADKE